MGYRERAMEKRSHLGMAGHYAAMAEFLYRGYNVAVPSVDVGDIRDDFVAADREKRGGRKPLSDTEAKGDRLTLRVEWSATEALGWGTSLREFLDQWPETFPENRTGPGAVTGSAPSLDHGTPADPSPPSDPPTDP